MAGLSCRHGTLAIREPNPSQWERVVTRPRSREGTRGVTGRDAHCTHSTDTIVFLTSGVSVNLENQVTMATTPLRCSDCGVGMEEMTLDAHAHNLRLVSEEERDGILGTFGLTQTYDVNAFVCPECGLVRLYADFDESLAPFQLPCHPPATLPIALTGDGDRPGGRDGPTCVRRRPSCPPTRGPVPPHLVVNG